MSELLSGNEAIAQGAWEAGVRLGAGYPGTPSTEILQNLVRHPDVYCEWSPNEKVAMEVASGAAYAGARTIVTMKHVGLNVAADPLLSLSYSGVRGGMVVVTADDPALHSSQNEQDNRHYARFAKLPMLEPADSEEAYLMTKYAFELSEKFDAPVLLRTTTRVNHARSLVKVRNRRPEQKPLPAFKHDREKFVLIPAHAAKRHLLVEQRMLRLSSQSDSSRFNEIEWGDKRFGVITSGVAYQYVKEAFPDWSVLKIGMSWPLPEQMIRSFAKRVGKLFVVEELDPFLEENIKSYGIKVKGKEKVPITGELDPDKVREALRGSNRNSLRHVAVPPRPPQLCKGCPHRGVFSVLRKLRLNVTGDIGCYTLGVLPPFEAMDTCLCMGAGLSQAHGMDKASGGKLAGRTVGVIGDSTFMHSGVSALMNIVYNKGVSTLIVMDNRTTAMTGLQPHPGTGRTLAGEETTEIDIATLAKALGVRRVFKADPMKTDELEELLKRELKEPEPSLIITNRPCIELLRKTKGPGKGGA